MKEALRMALEALEVLGWQPTEEAMDYRDNAIDAIKEALAQPEQQPVAMKFKIYLPVKHQINNAKLPWVYDQDRSTGFVASMWVTPVATLPPQRKPLTPAEVHDIWCYNHTPQEIVSAIEAAHGIKE